MRDRTARFTAAAFAKAFTQLALRSSINASTRGWASAGWRDLVFHGGDQVDGCTDARGGLGGQRPYERLRQKTHTRP